VLHTVEAGHPRAEGLPPDGSQITENTRETNRATALRLARCRAAVVNDMVIFEAQRSGCDFERRMDRTSRSVQQR
jgi:hypothetical protein